MSEVRNPVAPEHVAARDAWYQSLEDRYGETGYTPEDFRRLTLESAALNDEGLCWPPYVEDGMARMSLIIGMEIKGLIVRKNHGYHTPIEPHLITDKGRQYLADSIQGGG
jgi:hypothetical protein